MVTTRRTTVSSSRSSGVRITPTARCIWWPGVFHRPDAEIEKAVSSGPPDLEALVP